MPVTAQRAKEITQKQLDRGKTELGRLYEEWKALDKKVIRPARALFMAKDVYMKGAYKKIRQERRDLERQRPFLTIGWYNAKRRALDAREAELDRQIALPTAQAKLQEIAAGILRRNAPIAQECREKKEALEQLTALQDKRTHLIVQFTRQSIHDPQGTKYRVHVTPQQIPGYFTPQENLSVIAAACSGDERCTQLVARSKPNEPDEWRYLSETEKEDLKNNTARMDDFAR